MKQKRLFGSIASAMLLGLMALTSCVQTDLYDDFYDDMSSESMIARRKFKNDNGGPSVSHAQAFINAASSCGYQSSDFTISTNSSIQSVCEAWTSSHTTNVDGHDFHLECVGLKFGDGSALLYADPQAGVSVTNNNDGGKTITYYCNVPTCYTAPYQPTEVIHTHPGGSSEPSAADDEWYEGAKKKNKKLKFGVIGMDLDPLDSWYN